MNHALSDTGPHPGGPEPFPVFPPNGSTRATAQVAGSYQQKLIHSAQIALIDDEELILDVIEQHLRRGGFKNIHRTSDSRCAIDLVTQCSPDVLLLDVRMPHVSGLDILSELRNRPDTSHIPVVVLTACTQSDVKLKALKLGSSDFLAKPVDASELLLRLRNVLAVKAYRDHLANYSQELERQVRMRTEELVQSRRHNPMEKS